MQLNFRTHNSLIKISRNYVYFTNLKTMTWSHETSLTAIANFYCQHEIEGNKSLLIATMNSHHFYTDHTRV